MPIDANYLLTRISKAVESATRAARLNVELELARERKVTLPAAKRLVDEWLKAREILRGKS